MPQDEVQGLMHGSGEEEDTSNDHTEHDGSEEEEDTSIDHTEHVHIGIAILLFIAFIWVCTLSSALNHVDSRSDHFDWIWVFAAVTNILSFIVVKTGDTNSKHIMIAATIFVAQFPFYMTQVALVYPRHCTFTYYPKGNGTSYIGHNVQQLTAGVTTNDKEFIVECTLKICALPEATFCTDGARELFALLAHASPLVFAYGFKALFQSKFIGVISSAVLFAHMVDIQDFWMLLLEDDIVRNYWGRDNCDTDGWKCSGYYRFTWKMIMTAFWTSSSAALFSLVSAAFVVKARKLNQSMKNLILLQAFFGLVFHELPFLFLRLRCSLYFGVVASSLLMKNVIGIVVMAVMLRYQGDLKEFREQFPFWDRALKELASAVSALPEQSKHKATSQSA